MLVRVLPAIAAILGTLAQEHLLRPLDSTHRDALELVVVHDARGCASVRLRAIGTYKGLRPGHIEVEELEEPHRTRAHALQGDEEMLWEAARGICGADASWDFPVLREAPGAALVATGAQTPLMVQGAVYPPLEVAPLFEDRVGPSENRVDMMFFADGCE